ncbi:hypothetical protein [Sporanaerobium hydrogeniformans]|uniref:hypothetical protein n=1 Tax=Sporanaerobium hydrogeniformans TaxID=3072179 RepID=UPI0015D48DA9|nr:hypothetical protein [Sporanaerobium hydrogeniformans]
MEEQLICKRYYLGQLPYIQCEHQSLLLRQLCDVDMQYQYNKIINLKLAVEKLDGVTCIYPYRDLMIYNDTTQDYQLCLKVGKNI